ncbi:hypothetical protein Acr_16g0009470 [Actinidia rufa]|uniref:Uncharacterized protein n=1 Tax=Actinidia rufa TaxID=165716 RepID=A0A7J0G081_9ERIC|nr:hypothetical protein Acr_16g0009470 [Actinidia rufa]
MVVLQGCWLLDAWHKNHYSDNERGRKMHAPDEIPTQKTFLICYSKNEIHSESILKHKIPTQKAFSTAAIDRFKIHILRAFSHMHLGANGEINIWFGLEDIVYLTGFSIDGKTVTGVDHENSGSICITYLVAFLPLLEDITEIKDHAWGATLLAHLHWSMSKIRSNNKLRKELFRLCICAFALERIVALALDYGFPEKTLRDSITQFLLPVSWTNGLQRDTKDNFRNHSLAIFVQLLEGLQANEIRWQIYQRLPTDFLPLSWGNKPSWANPELPLFALKKSSEDVIPPITSGPNISEPSPFMAANYEYPQPGLIASRVEVEFAQINSSSFPDQEAAGVEDLQPDLSMGRMEMGSF